MEAWYAAFMGLGPKKIPHWEHLSCPDAETYLTGIDYYDHPKLCRERMKELYPQINLGIPATDEPRPRPRFGDDISSDSESHTVRWGDGETGTWEHGEAIFHSVDDVLAFSPLAKGDFSDWPHVVMAEDFSSEEVIYQRLRKNFPAEWGDKAPEGSAASAWFYNTMFMWPMLTFGWELFLEACLLPEFDRVMEEFGEINRRVFKAFARLPINFAVCHDDIVNTRGLVCSPSWMKKHIYPRYEELWGILKDAGKEVIFMTDGRFDPILDDVMACGARGVISEPYGDYKAAARKYKDIFLAGEGDNRVLMSNNRAAIRQMVENMVETAQMTGGYMMCVGNHIPWNIPPEAIKYYFELSEELAYRG